MDRIFRSQKKGPTRQAILDWVRHHYGDHADDVIRELDRYQDCTQASRDRVQWAILQLHTGTIENLKRWVNIAVGDYRDVVGPYEYPTAATEAMVTEVNSWTLDRCTESETSFEQLD